jgi:hypothetical protein
VANATTVSNIWALAVNSAGVFAAIVYIPSVGPGYMTSTDGVTWTTPTLIPGATSGVFFFNAALTVDSSGKFVATGYEGFSSTPWSAVSANGSTWAAQQISASTLTARTATWSSYHNLFVTVGAITGGLGYMTSADGVTWSAPTAITGSTSPMSILSMTVNSAGVFVGVGQIQGASTTPIYMTSTNGTDWCVPTSFNGSTDVGFMRGIVYSSSISKFVAVVLSILVFYILFNVGVYFMSQFFMPAKDAKVVDGLIPSNTRIIVSANPNITSSVPILRSVNQNQGLEFTWIYLLTYMFPLCALPVWLLLTVLLLLS